MKTIAVSDPSEELKALLEQARQESLILQAPDGSEFILEELDDFDKEIELTRQNKELMALLDQRGQEKAIVSHEELKKMLGLK
jgi:hypothetical protein